MLLSCDLFHLVWELPKTQLYLFLIGRELKICWVLSPNVQYLINNMFGLNRSSIFSTARKLNKARPAWNVRNIKIPNVSLLFEGPPSMV